MQKWSRVRFQPNLPLEPGKYVTACAEHIALSKEAAGEGMVLLKNEKNLLYVACTRAQHELIVYSTIKK